MYIKGSGVLIQRKDNKILLLFRQKGVPEAERYGLAGGVVRPEMGILGTAVYKSKMETGLVLPSERFQFLNKFEFTVNDDKIEYYVYYISLNTNNIEIIIDKNGHTKYDWFDPIEAEKRDDLMSGMYPILKEFNKFNR